jgi:AraC-like DNA-binding protein
VQFEPLHTTTLSETRCGERVLHLRVAGGVAHLSTARQALPGGLPQGWEGLIAVADALKVDSGSVRITALSTAPLIKLQAFVDTSTALRERQPNDLPWATLPVPWEIIQSDQALEHWYLRQMLAGESAYQAFASVLRRSESYAIVRFLLEQGTHSEKLTSLAERYGVSVSHFRRLCRLALGSSTKPALRGWRTAQALLSMSLEGGSLTHVAMAFGFASSSHFSREVRELVGFAPSHLADITYLPGK